MLRPLEAHTLKMFYTRMCSLVEKEAAEPPSIVIHTSDGNYAQISSKGRQAYHLHFQLTAGPNVLKMKLTAAAHN